jgi:hypothetical protein
LITESSFKVNCEHCYAEIISKIEHTKAYLQKCSKHRAGETQSVNSGAKCDAAIAYYDQPSISIEVSGTVLILKFASPSAEQKEKL